MNQQRKKNVVHKISPDLVNTQNNKFAFCNLASSDSISPCKQLDALQTYVENNKILIVFPVENISHMKFLINFIPRMNEWCAGMNDCWLNAFHNKFHAEIVY